MCPRLRSALISGGVMIVLTSWSRDLKILLERCPHFRGCYVQRGVLSLVLVPMELEPDDVSK